MNEAVALIRKLDREHRIYLEKYFADAPFWLMDSFQIVRLPKNRTFITEGEEAEESIFLKAGREKFRKWFEHDFCAYRMESKKVGRYLLAQARKERLYVLLQGVERIYLVLYKMYQTYARNGQCSLYMSRKDFTETAGVSERTVSRTLKTLEEKGCITREGWKIRITEEQYRMLRRMLEDKLYEFEE